jgi:hypothetical protein
VGEGRRRQIGVADGTDGTFIRRDSLDTGFKVPMWLLFSF